jgi:hypothetical protein
VYFSQGSTKKIEKQIQNEKEDEKKKEKIVQTGGLSTTRRLFDTGKHGWSLSGTDRQQHVGFPG